MLRRKSFKTFTSSATSLVSPKQVAEALGVSESSVKRWCDQGELSTVRTPGGHRRVAVASVLRFAAESGHPVRDLGALGEGELERESPEFLAKQAELDVREERNALRRALIDGDIDAVRASLSVAWVRGTPVDVLCDERLAPAFADIGERWVTGGLEIYVERRACEITLRVLRELGDKLIPLRRGAPRALGASREHDPYALPTTMVELVLRERGFDATSLGTRLPIPTLVSATRELKPELVWLCVGACDDPERLVEECAELENAARDVGAALVLGGRALTPELRQRLRCSAFCDGMQHLASLGDAILRARKRQIPPAHAVRTRPARRRRGHLGAGLSRLLPEE
jgi:excisionase family DNA binding protein